MNNATGRKREQMRPTQEDAGFSGKNKQRPIPAGKASREINIEDNSIENTVDDSSDRNPIYKSNELAEKVRSLKIN